MAEQPAWHARALEACLAELSTDAERGLTSEEAARRRQRWGLNELEDGRQVSAWRLLLAQFSDLMVVVLLGAAAVSWALGESLDAMAIVAIVLVNALLGFWQEMKAEQSLAALRQLAAPHCRVVRDGQVVEIDAREVVPGDIVVLGAGDRVPADARLLFASAVEVDESLLTGESVPVRKDAAWQGRGPEALGDRRNMLFMGTTLIRGSARAVVVTTGMQTEIGHIARLIGEAEEGPTPLQRRLDQLGRWLVAGCFLVVLVVVAAGLLQGRPAFEMFLTGVSLAVAAIPEGLPAVVTVALAFGVQRMIRRQAIVRRLPAVETLGCTTVICSDKTGTLTRNEMTVVRVELLSGSVQVTGSGYDPQGQLLRDGRPVDRRDPDVRMALEVAALCNEAALVPPPGRAQRGQRRNGPERSLGEGWRAIGDPTEAALLVLARKGGLPREALLEGTSGPEGRPVRILGGIPFEPERRRMSTVVRRGDRLYSLVKGAPDTILERCTRGLRRGQVVALAPKEVAHMRRLADELAGQALRVLALAYRDLGPARALPDPPPEALLERELVFVGLVAMLDPPRTEVRHAIQVARRAGIRTLMLTGDHRATAAAIAAQLGLAGPRDPVVTGPDLDRLSDEQLARVVREAHVFARVSPAHKLRIVRALRRQGEVVAMTGDGVNDAPAVKEADIGIAMGRTGTEVTKEAAAMILADDNYATIVAAVEEGRGIYANIRKFIRYLLGCNAGEVLTMFGATLLDLPLPLTPLQILWMNLVTDGLPAVALGVDPADPDIMERPPRRPNEGVFAHRLHLRILLRGVSIALSTLTAFALSLFFLSPQDVERARTVAFTTLVLSQLFYVFQCRSERHSLFELDPLGNPYLVAATGVSMAMQLAVLYVPALAQAFRTVPLAAPEWLVVAVLSGWSVVTEAVLYATWRLRRHLSLVRV